MIYIWDKTRRKVSEVLRCGEMCVGWWISPVKKWLYAKRASARTFKVAYHFHNEKQMIKLSSLAELLSRVATVYHFFAGHFGLPHRLSAVGSHHTLYYWSFGCCPSWWGLFTLFFWRFFRYRIRDEEMRWYHQSEARHAFLKRDAILLGITSLQYYFHYESHIDKPRNWWQTTLESGRTVHTFSLVIRIRWLSQEYNYTEKVKVHFAAR